jgi:hypothetical protein
MSWSNFNANTRFLKIKKKYIVNNFSIFNCRYLKRGHFITTWQGKKVVKTTSKFFPTVHSHGFSKIFVTFDIITEWVNEINEIIEQFQLPWAPEK